MCGPWGGFLSGTLNITLAEHWNGSAWDVVPSSNLGTSDNYLRGVAIVSGNDVWAVGNYYNASTYQTLTEHWNGSAWSVIPSPNVGTHINTLYGVAAVSGSDVWAVGYFYTGSLEQTLTEHWNGSAWSVVTSPNAANNNELYGVAAISGSDAWAVGYFTNGASAGQTLTEHWNGSAWSVIPSPNLGTSSNELLGVDMASADNVWAVGDYYDQDISTHQTLVEQWNGSAWSVVPSANLGTIQNTLFGVVANLQRGCVGRRLRLQQLDRPDTSGALGWEPMERRG